MSCCCSVAASALVHVTFHPNISLVSFIICSIYTQHSCRIFTSRDSPLNHTNLSLKHHFKNGVLEWHFRQNGVWGWAKKHYECLLHSNSLIYTNKPSVLTPPGHTMLESEYILPNKPWDRNLGIHSHLGQIINGFSQLPCDTVWSVSHNKWLFKKITEKTAELRNIGNVFSTGKT